jgi:hypothetical protein
MVNSGRIEPSPGALALLALGLLACGSPTAATDDTSEGGSSRGDDAQTDDADTVPPADSSGAGSSGEPGGTSGVASTSSSDDDDVVEEGPIVFDVDSTSDLPPIQDGCNAVDFLFVIDNSGSMFDNQVNLISNFPTFSEGIQATLVDVTSYQVGVVASDAYQLNDPPCGQLGDLVISTQGGFDSSNMVCGPYADGHNYMTEEDDLVTSFACAAQLGSGGSGGEKPMEAMMQTLSDFHDGEDECNEGFIRDEALLVVVIISDEADGPGDPDGIGQISVGDPEVWYQAVVDAKDGIEQNAVVMSLIHYNAGEDEDPSSCPPATPVDNGENIKVFTQMFEQNGFVGGICVPDYGPLFEEATSIIEVACDNFIPPN